MFNHLKILNVENIYKHEVVKLIHSVHYNYCPPAFHNFFELSSHTYSTRLKQNSSYALSKPKTDLGKRSLKFSGVKIWSKLAQSVKDHSERKKINSAFKQKNLFLICFS